MKRIEKRFRDLRAVGKKAFIVFITAGYPNLKTTAALLKEFERVGVDIVELGVPFTDPMADGAVIQEASCQALRQGVNLPAIMQLVKGLRNKLSFAICLMSYYNPILCYGEERFVRDAVRCGVDALIVPDLSPEEGSGLRALARRGGLDLVYFLSPTSTVKRIRYISRQTSGFLYYVSLTGVTGARKRLAAQLRKNVLLIKRYTDKPVCVGFGVSTPAQARQVGLFADGIIVGSAIIKKIKDNLGSPQLVKRVGRFVQSFFLRQCTKKAD
jgi:tryptophan synthase alpha chain